MVPKEEVKQHVNRSTFKCPFCPASNLPRADLVTHVLQMHKKQAGVCPICITYPHGDPNYVSRDLAGHLNLRHQYEMGEVIENETDE